MGFYERQILLSRCRFSSCETWIPMPDARALSSWLACASSPLVPSCSKRCALSTRVCFALLACCTVLSCPLSLLNDHSHTVCRGMLGKLAQGTLTECKEAVLCRPGQPFWVSGHADRAVALFPLYLRSASDDALTTAVAQACTHNTMLVAERTIIDGACRNTCMMRDVRSL